MVVCLDDHFIRRWAGAIDDRKDLIAHGYAVPVTFDGAIPFTDSLISVGGKNGSAYFVLDFRAQYAGVQP